MTQPRPIVKTKRHPLTNTPVNGDSTIMDDTVMTMDGTGLMGGPVTLSSGIKANVKSLRYFSKVKKRR